MSSDTSRLERRDPRLDRVGGYAVQAVTALLIAIGGWYARETGAKVDAAAAQIADLRTELAVLRTSGQDAAEMRQILRALQLQVTALQSEVLTLRRDVDRPR